MLSSIKRGASRIGNTISRYGKACAATAVIAGGAIVGNAQAAYVLPTEAAAVFTDASAAVTTMESAIWPVIGVATVAVVAIKLFKRFVGKV